MSDSQDFSALPLEERLGHKVWKVRLEAYEQAATKFSNSRNDHDECFRIFNEQGDLLKKAVTDSNVVAQESGLLLLLQYLKFGGNASNVLKLKNTGLISVLVEKGLSSSRAGTKSKTIECLLYIVEISSNGELVVEEILPFLDNRLPKLVSGCVTGLHAIVENFGCRVVQPNLILPKLPKLFAHADRNVRAETTKLTIELAKWMGDALENVLFPELKPVQQKDLTKAFAEVKGRIPEQIRLTRKQQIEIEKQKQQMADEEARLATGNPSNDIEMEDAEPSGQEAAFDPTDLLEPVDVISKLPSDLSNRISSTKWKERKEVLEEVYEILKKAVKPAPKDDYTDLFRIFSKCSKDANIQVVQLAANCVEILAKGLKGDFQRYRHLVLAPIIERTKEKKASLAEALSNALDAIFAVCSLPDILEDTLNGMKHKTPQVKISTTNYLKRCLASTTIYPTGNEINQIMSVSVKLLGDSQEPVRQAATEMIGTLMKITGERELNGFLEEVDDNRKLKVKKVFEEAKVNVKTNPSSVNAPQTKRPNIAASEPPRLNKPKSSMPSTSSTSKRTAPPSTSTNLKANNNNLGLSSSTIPSKRGATSPAKRPDEMLKASTIGRGLTGRSLTNSSIPSSNTKPESVTNQKDKEELEAFRRDKQNWLEKNKELTRRNEMLEHDNLNLKNENSSLLARLENVVKENSNTLLMLKQKDSQINRSSSDLENAKLKIRDLEQTIEMMKLQQKSYVSTQSPQIGSYGSIFHNNSTTSPPSNSDTSTTLGSTPASQTRVNSGELSNRVNRLSIDGTSQKENPESTYKFSSISRSRFTSPQRMVDNTNTFSNHAGKEHPDILSDDDSWRRAAEVTTQLKARIEKMKARSRSGLSNFQ
ncbi:Piso0_000951 [Millerozyma farinosa CBS 7064]|uniref:Piso0_000951 protein n=1 Tax=Pichia sorbitophila (strain ATCC MYA-4447 / BCRC 22081 / CBS 7064 / NBRC 10061 / NRRL Y-12695) TaxID=559304 RepID=G8YRZ3_PICSO|nr:Piso0_000951 [Millerozyma farinosa CBS 7064]